MKKLLFASACVAAVAAFGDSYMCEGTYNATGLEGYTAGVGDVGLRNDNGVRYGEGAGPFFWWYQAKDSSTDGSTVKAYGIDDNLPAFDYTKLVPQEFIPVSGQTMPQNNYLELSTEGGTLWRSFTDTGDAQGLGAGFDMGEDGNYTKFYVDTMVQFTPTEDGGTPAVETEDKLAIWLNVVTSEETGEATTNLCVLAGDFYGAPQIHKVANAGNIKPGVWYRLTVKGIDDISNGNMHLPGFKVWIDGKLLTSTEAQAISDDDLEFLYDEGYLDENEVAEIQAGSVFASLRGSDASPIFQGIGFKGSGAIDDLVITDDEPNFIGAATSLDFTLSWGEGVSAVSYTIGNVTTPAVNGQKVECDAGAVVTINATPADWYVIDSASVAALTVDAADTTRTITASLAATPADAGATGLDGVTTEAAKAWATAKGLTPAGIGDCDFALNAYLMNTDLSAAPGLQITSITEVENGWQITVKGTQGDTTVSLAGINGQLNIKAAATLEGLAEAEATPVNLTADQFDEAGVATITVTGDNKNFMKATVGVKVAPAAE